MYKEKSQNNIFYNIFKPVMKKLIDRLYPIRL